MQPLYRADAWRILAVLFGALLLQLILLGGYANANKGLGVFASGAAITIASFAAGSLLGLLFGAPHASDQSGGSSSRWTLLPNTSFDQMADWLTKIIVGVGLTQLTAIPSRLQALGAYLAPALGGTDTSASVAVTLVLGAAVIGFMASFVFTKLVLSPDLAEAGYETLKDRAQTAVNRIAGAKRLSSADQRRAVNLAEGLARAHLATSRSQGLQANDWETFATHAVEMVSEPETRTPTAIVGNGDEPAQK